MNPTLMILYSGQPVHDLPGSRQSIRTVATRGNAYAMLTFALLGSGLFLYGLIVGGAKATDDAVYALPEPVVLMCVGMMTFALFFPSFLALFYARHLLISIEWVEVELSRLQNQAANAGARSTDHAKQA